MPTAHARHRDYCIVVAALLLLGTFQDAGAGMTKENDRYSVEVSIKAVAVEGGEIVRPQAVLTDKYSGKVSRINLESAVKEITNILFGKDAFVVLGTIPIRRGEEPAGYVATIGLVNGSLNWQTFARGVSVSPDGTRVAYGTFEPLHPVRGSMRGKWYVISLDDPGIPERVVFPKGGYPEPPEGTYLKTYAWSGRPRVLWSPDGMAILFFAHLSTWVDDDPFEMFRVVVDLREGPAQPNILLKQLQPADLLNHSSERFSGFHPQELRNTGDDTITVTYSGSLGGEPPKELKLKWSEILPRSSSTASGAAAADAR